MGILAAGTTVPGSTDPRTVEQNNTIQRLQDASPDGRVPSSYRGSFLYPNGVLTRDETFLVKPIDRIKEINDIIAAGTDPSKPSGGYILILNEDGVPIQYFGIGPVSSVPTPSSLPIKPTPTPTQTPIPVTPVNALSFLKFTPDINSIFTKRYIWKSMSNIQSDTINVENISTLIPINVRFESLHGSILVPESFVLYPGQNKNVIIKYSNDMLEKIIPFEGKFQTLFNVHVRGV